MATSQRAITDVSLIQMQTPRKAPSELGQQRAMSHTTRAGSPDGDMLSDINWEVRRDGDRAWKKRQTLMQRRAEIIRKRELETRKMEILSGQVYSARTMVKTMRSSTSTTFHQSELKRHYKAIK